MGGTWMAVTHVAILLLGMGMGYIIGFHVVDRHWQKFVTMHLGLAIGRHRNRAEQEGLK